MMRRLGEDRGSVGLELAILAPVFLALMMLMIVSARTSTAANLVAAAAHDSARAASLARGAPAAHTAAQRAADMVLAGHGYACTQHSTSADVSGFHAPAGQPAVVTVSVSCTITYADLLKVPGLPGSKVITDSFTSPLDTYRER